MSMPSIAAPNVLQRRSASCMERLAVVLSALFGAGAVRLALRGLGAACASPHGNENEKEIRRCESGFCYVC